MIAIDLSRRRELHTDPEAIQQINFYWKFRSRSNTVFHYRRSKRNYFGFFTRNSERIVNICCFDKISKSNDYIYHSECKIFKLVLIDLQVLRLCKAFVNNSSANIN